MIESIFKLLEQENDSAKRTYKVVIKIGHWLLCANLCVWIMKKLGYDLNILPFNFETVIKLFSEYYLLAGITIFVLVSEAIRVASLILSFLLSRWTVPEMAKNVKQTPFESDFSKVLRAVKMINEDPAKLKESTYKVLIAIVEKDRLGVENLVHVFISFTLSYLLIIQEQYPHLYSIWITITIGCITMVILFFFGFINYLDSIATIARKQLMANAKSNTDQKVENTLIDFVKGAGLFSLPVQLMTTAQERVRTTLKEVVDRVPKEKQIMPDSTFAGQIIERLTYIDNTHYLKKYYLNLLENSINIDLVNLAHPAFTTVIQQLAPDEVKILERIRSGTITIALEYDKEEGKIVGEVVLSSDFELGDLSFPQHRTMYVNHLQLLNLIKISFPQPESFSPSNQKFHRTVSYELNEFGRLFIKACSR